MRSTLVIKASVLSVISGMAVVFAAQTAGSSYGASASQPTNIKVFEADFDSSSSSMIAALGDIYAFLANQNAVHISPDLSGNNKLVIDDSFSVNGLPTAIACAFEGHSIYSFGTLSYSAEISFGASATPFATGIIVDAPQSNMAPVAGPDGDGTLILGGVDSGVTVPPGQALEVSASYARISPSKNWQYLVTVTAHDASGEEILFVTATGVLENTAGKPIVGVAFEKKTGASGQVTIDDVTASYSPVSEKFDGAR